MKIGFSSSEDYKKIFKFDRKNRLRIVSREGNRLEFKQTFNWLSKSSYAKSMAAFANNTGGLIVYGVSNDPRNLVGLTGTNFGSLDEAKISEYLNSIFSPELEFEKFIIEIRGLRVGILYVQQSKKKPVICIKTDTEIKEGDIYYRYNARSEKVKYPELQLILEEIKEKERNSWMDLFQKVSKIGPSNVAVVDLLNGNIEGSGDKLLIDQRLLRKIKFINEGTFKEGGLPTLKLIGDVQPVMVTAYKTKKTLEKLIIQTTDNPKAPMVRLEEKDLRKLYPINYKTLIGTLRRRYSNFKLGKRFYAIFRDIKKDKNFVFTRYLDPQKPESSKKNFYSPKIYRAFDRSYLRKR